MRKSLSLNLAAGAIGLMAATSFADIKVSDALTLNGFFDMSATTTLPKTGPAAATATLDQFELDFLFKLSDKLTARADYSNASVEQAFISYSAAPALTIQAGKFLSASGWEAAEPTGMYQFSASNALVYGGYQNGVNVTYTLSPMISVYAAFVDGIWVADGDIKRPGIEAQVALMPTKEITIKADNLFQQQAGYISDVVNVWAAYIAGPLTAAVEADILTNYDADGAGPGTGEDNNGFGGLVMANYKLTDVIAVTGRYSILDTDAAGTNSEATVSPSYMLAPNWLILAEAKYQIDAESLGLAVETTVTF
jgi:hypothetical protein